MSRHDIVEWRSELDSGTIVHLVERLRFRYGAPLASMHNTEPG